MISQVLSLVCAATGLGQNMMSPQLVDDPIRLALTPKMDGSIQDQEWEPFVDSAESRTFFQWEPGMFYWGAKAPIGKDIVISLDANGDGWLLGTDNVEIRCRLVGTDVQTTIRQLDASDRNGPKWVDPALLPEALRITGSVGSDGWNLEVSLQPIQFTENPEENRRIGLRMDVVDGSFDSGPSYTPRSLNFVTLRFDNSKGLFSGLTWRPQVRTRLVSRYDKLKFRFNFETFEDCPAMQTVDLSGEGLARNAIKTVGVPFPKLDKKGNAFVDYESEIGAESASGYRILRAAIVAADGRIAVVRTSFRISPLVDLDPNFKMKLPYSIEPQRVKGGVTIKSQALGRVEGAVSIRYPAEWTSIGKLDQQFLIYHSKGSWRMPIEFQVPAGASGVFPVVLSAKVGDESVFETVYVMVGQ